MLLAEFCKESVTSAFESVGRAILATCGAPTQIAQLPSQAAPHRLMMPRTMFGRELEGGVRRSAADSPIRRIVKRIAAPLLSERAYALLRAMVAANDIRTLRWYEPEIDLVSVGVRPGDTVLDIGANHGLWSYHLSRAAEASGRVVAFEPVPSTARVLQNVAAILGFSHNVSIEISGCGENRCRAPFTLPIMDNGSVSTGLVHMGRKDAARGWHPNATYTRSRTIVCNVIPVDECLSTAENLTFIKCDVEGAELFVMRGARRSIERHRPAVVLEISPWFLAGFDVEVGDVLRFFEHLDYDCYRYSKRRLHLAIERDIQDGNWLFLHRENRQRYRRLMPRTLEFE